MAKKQWYNMKSVPLAAGSASAANIEMNIFDVIGGWGISASQFIGDFNALMKTTGAKQATLYINSPGGSVFDGWAILNTFNAAKAKGLVLNVKIMGIAASMASVIAMAGTTIEMPANSMMMIHNAITGTYGNAEEMRDTADTLDKIDDSIVATYVARTGKTEEDVRAMMAVETFMSAQEALDGGFATAVSDAMKVDNSFDVEMLSETAQAAYKTALRFKNAAAKPPAKKVVPPKTAPKVDPDADPDMDPDDPQDVEIFALAKEAGFPEFAAQWCVAAADLEEATVLVAQAQQVKRLCATAKMPEMANAFIKEAKPVAEVRAELLAAMQAVDSKTVVKATNKDAITAAALNSAGAAKPTRSATAIYAARAQQIGGTKTAKKE